MPASLFLNPWWIQQDPAMGLLAGLVPAAVAAVAFGVQYVPVKKYKHLGCPSN